MVLSNLEKIRQQNIIKNQLILKKLNLDKVSKNIYNHLKTNQDQKKNTSSKNIINNRVTKQPIRKSKRLRGIKIDPVYLNSDNTISVGSNDFQNKNSNTNNLDDYKKKLKELEKQKLAGDVKLVDVLKKYQNKTAKNTNKNTNKNDNKNLIQDEIELVNIFNEIGKSLSTGDFYDITSDFKLSSNNTNVKELRSFFNNLNIYPHALPNDINLTTTRITYINFHPTVDKKLIFAGDTEGDLGIWNVNDHLNDDLNLQINNLKIHTKHIIKLEIQPQNNQNLITSSYDGSIRLTNFEKSISSNLLDLTDSTGISDFNFISLMDPNLIYFTTLLGQFGLLDLRIKNKNIQNYNDLFRIHDKKIGSFSISPQNEFQISTASLDRSMKIWDIRKINKQNQFTEKFLNEKSFDCYGYYNSKLSISSSDWNSSGDIVCNGYDNTIRIFNNVNRKLNFDQNLIEFKPDRTIQHNCKTGKWVSILKSKWQKLPKDNIEKFLIGNMKKYIDVYTSDGIQIGHLGGPEDNVKSIPAVVQFHPLENWIVGGSAYGKCVLYF
ncbi:Cmr1p [Ascoidea rubescens DSM 1968]|uniref:DNA damage-binding protein CMR1 n=1 Tax=Ascoidea rubescens DSM 1968 TaxID=1344418 RepID=A0A1D2V8E5_9ASCO|nr:WD40 repeat-like protein [Ascoidea rubescens DSM 1968]ODV57946.1 WD40 repeat-like protein [Ascoidea rubescens DSM 1968]